MEGRTDICLDTKSLEMYQTSLNGMVVVQEYCQQSTLCLNNIWDILKQFHLYEITVETFVNRLNVQKCVNPFSCGLSNTTM